MPLPDVPVLNPSVAVRQRVDSAGHVSSKRRADTAVSDSGDAAASAATVLHSALAELDQRGGARIRFPRTLDGPLQAVLLNTAGGLTGDDLIAWSATAGAGSHLRISTAACEKLYRTHGPCARQSTELRVEAGARLDWLPQETIVFDGAALRRSLTVHIASDATALLAETIVLGRQAMPELITRLSLHDRWRIYRDNRLLHAEDLRLDFNDFHDARRQGMLHHYGTISTIVLVSPSPMDSLTQLADRIELSVPEDAALITAATSVMQHRLVVRILAENSLSLRRFLIPCIEILNNDMAVPQVWNV